MPVVILNYIVSIFIIALGVSLVSGIFNIDSEFGEGNSTLLGGICLFWGLFRLIMYHIRRKHYSNRGGKDD